ncbi:MAG: glycosyltransferase family 2 protein [Candidatus Microgenomates bacterium]|jgi:GT2 family glycosyltransferase
MGKLNVSIIIPNYNGSQLLRKNLLAVVAASEYAPNRVLEIIVVDDGSQDNSVRFLKKNYPAIRLFRHKVNRGFSAAVNTGARAAKGELIILINSDVIPSKDFLAPALRLFENKKVFAVSLHEKGFGWAKGSFSDGFIQLGMGEETPESHSSFYVSGDSGVFRRKYWIELGGMDEKLLSPFYWEDIDLCYRAEKRGYLNLWEPEANVIHNHESTISKLPKSYVQRIKERNQLLVIWKNIQSPTLIRKHFAGVFKRVIQHPGYFRIVLMALGKLGIVLKERKKEIKLSSISDEAVFSKFG